MRCSTLSEGAEMRFGRPSLGVCIFEENGVRICWELQLSLGRGEQVEAISQIAFLSMR